ncbi:conserved hypothetical protein [Candida dubliniensis CD36]|uniref:Protein CMS1 n=1 Tax=Candida dubliniensis (strain CD36 / ATCC MYA-646 / CBS 7987 / NCPF 3949 / NRRL Y-17841) TaxID=573826 RepID=B9W8G1_CANDC|nr:conserved hypothetical protein [Candida dubliniensis CD36]CAX45032.1 conserved hypothetical protein [Candida dubliniensis CD36]
MSKQEQQPVADDLDDGLEYDVQLSDTEDVGFVNGSWDEGITKDETETNDNTTTTTTASSLKRRNSNTSNTLKEKKRLKMEIDIESKKNLSLEENPEIIAEFINNKIRRKNPNLSALELTELYFNKSEIRSTSDFKDTRNLDNLSKYINSRFKNMLPKGAKKDKKKNNKKGKKEEYDSNKDSESDNKEERKFIAIVSMSAIRACDIHRATKDLVGSSIKLINKNKLHVDLKLVKSTRSRVLCCTPGRLSKVLNSEESGLSKDEIKIVIIDNSYLDTKKQNIWDIKETFEALKELTKSGSKLYLY